MGAFLAALLAVGALAACGASARSAEASACGAGAPEVLATTAGDIAGAIYAGELASRETVADRRQVEGDARLLHAVASGERTAVAAAVTALVYSGTHIVRLRVMKGSELLADVGGPYIIAPVTGTLRLHGRTIGRYVLSVQDDLGFVKLETRFVGAPLVMRLGARGIPLEGLVAGPPQIPAHGPVRYRGTTYQAFSFDALAFPSGMLRISLLVPLPAGIARESCPQVRSNELAVVAERISRRFALAPSNFLTYLKLVRSLTGGMLYIRSGSRQLAATDPGPSRLPASGTVRYRHATYQVSSFETSTSVGPVRVYELLAP